MSTRQLITGSLLAVSALTLGCESPAAPAEAAALPSPGLQLDFTNGPSTPNVFRTEDAFVFGAPDADRELLAWAGLPANPSDAIECGGTLDFDLMPIQNAGELQEAFNVLALGRDVHIHVYDLATFSDTCTDTPIAAGTGNMTMNDNDAPVAGPGANSFGVRMQGTLEDLVNGGTVRLSAESRLLITPDGSFRVVSSHVSLHPVGR